MAQQKTGDFMHSTLAVEAPAAIDTLDDLVAEYSTVRNLEPGAIKALTAAIKKLSNWRRNTGRGPCFVRDLSEQLVNSLLDTMCDAGYAPGGLNNIANDLCRLWGFAADRNLVVAPDLAKIYLFSQPRRVPSTWSQGELDKIEDVAKKYKASPTVPGWDGRNDFALVRFVRATGCGLETCLALTWANLDDDGRVTFGPNTPGPKVCQLTPEAFLAIKATRRPEAHGENEPLFPWPHSPNWYWTRYARILKAAGFRPNNKSGKIRKLQRSSPAWPTVCKRHPGSQPRGKYRIQYGSRVTPPDGMQAKRDRKAAGTAMPPGEAARLLADDKPAAKLKAKQQLLAGLEPCMIDPRFEELCKKYAKVRRLEPETIRTINKTLRPFLRWHYENTGMAFGPDKFGAVVVNAFLRKLFDDGKSPLTLKVRSGLLISFWRFAEENDWAPPVDEAKIDRFPVEETTAATWSPAELEAIKEAAKNSQASPAVPGWDSRHDYALMLLVLDTGFNLKDCFSLKPSNIAADGRLQIGTDTPPLAAESRLRPPTLAAVQATGPPTGDEPIFPWLKGDDAFRKRLTKIVESAGIPLGRNDAFQTLRNSAVTTVEEALQPLGRRNYGTRRRCREETAARYLDPQIVERLTESDNRDRDDYCRRRQDEGTADETIIKEVGLIIDEQRADEARKDTAWEKFESVQAMRSATGRLRKKLRLPPLERKVGRNPKNHIDTRRRSSMPIRKLETDLNANDDLATVAATYSILRNHSPRRTKSLAIFARVFTRWFQQRTAGRDFRLEDFSEKVINDFLHDLRTNNARRRDKPPGNGTLNIYRSALLTLSRFAAAAGLAGQPDAARIDKFCIHTRVPKAHSRADVKKLQLACRSYSPKRQIPGWSNAHDYALINFILETAFGAAECFALKRSDFDDEGQLVAETENATRTEMPRLSPPAAAAVKAIFPTNKDARVFPWPSKPSRYAARFRRILELARLPHAFTDVVNPLQQLVATAVTWRAEALLHRVNSPIAEELSPEEALDKVCYDGCQDLRIPLKTTAKLTGLAISVVQFRGRRYADQHREAPRVNARYKPRGAKTAKTKRSSNRRAKRLPR